MGYAGVSHLKENFVGKGSLGSTTLISLPAFLVTFKGQPVK
jgi:hypothetical protein